MIRSELIHACRHGRVLVNSYSGLGDALIQAPVLRALQRLAAKPVLFPSSRMLELVRMLGVTDLSRVEGFNSEYRRFLARGHNTVTDHLQQLGVTFVLDLRWDRKRWPNEYEALRAAFAMRGIASANFCDMEQCDVLHIAELSALLLRYHGITVDAKAGWLRPFILPSAEMCELRGLGIFVGASHPIKQLSNPFWLQVIEGLAASVNHPLVLFSGNTTEERAGASLLAAALKKRKIEMSFAEPAGLLQFARQIAALQLLVSTDSFAVHLAESLEVPVLSIHTSTSPDRYGPRMTGSRAILSPFYARCPHANSIGNCTGWDNGCAKTPCKDSLRPAEVLEAVAAMLTGRIRQDFSGEPT